MGTAAVQEEFPFTVQLYIS